MPLVHLMIGIPGSGKTTYAHKLAREWNIRVISTDQIRKLHPDWPEDLIWPEVYKQCAQELQTGHDMIFDATNITPKVRKRFIEQVQSFCHDNFCFGVGAYFLDIDPQICYERVVKRNTQANELYLPPEVVLSYGDKIIPPSQEENFSFIKYIKIDQER